MAGRSDVVQFFRSDPALLLDQLDQLDRDRDGWVNLQAVTDDEEQLGGSPVRAGLFAWVAARGPALPACTWVPSAPGKRAEPDSIGIQHPAGPRAWRRLLAAGVAPPEGAALLSDHPRRGLVVTVPQGTSPRDVLAWIFAACDELADDPLPDSWVAVVHHR